MRIIAHRGASQEYPENTLAAFRRALEIGVDEIETDLVETCDGVILLHHDEVLQRGSELIPICRLPCEEVRKINPEIPRLDEVLEELGGQVPFCLELKVTGLADRVAALIQNYGCAVQTHITSFLITEVLKVKALCPESLFSWTYSKLPPEGEKALRRAGIDAVSLSREHLERETVERLQSLGIKTRVFTVNDPELAEQYASWGVDAIFTDDPKRMLRLRER